MPKLTDKINPKSDAMILTIEFRFANGKREEVRISEDTGIEKADCVRYKGSIFVFQQKRESDFYIEARPDYFLDLDAYQKDKPNIEDIFTAFQQFQNDSRRSLINVAEHKKTREAFRAKFREFGLEDMIDWSDKS